MSDLAARLKAVIEERLRVAREAGNRGMNWTADPGYRIGRVDHDGRDGTPIVSDEGVPTGDEALHIALNDPADAILAGEWALGVLERHAPVPILGRAWCEGCDAVVAASAQRTDRDEPPPWPCDEIRAMAKRYGLEVE